MTIVLSPIDFHPYNSPTVVGAGAIWSDGSIVTRASWTGAKGGWGYFPRTAVEGATSIRVRIRYSAAAPTYIGVILNAFPPAGAADGYVGLGYTLPAGSYADHEYTITPADYAGNYTSLEAALARIANGSDGGEGDGNISLTYADANITVYEVSLILATEPLPCGLSAVPLESYGHDDSVVPDAVVGPTPWNDGSDATYTETFTSNTGNNYVQGTTDNYSGPDISDLPVKIRAEGFRSDTSSGTVELWVHLFSDYGTLDNEFNLPFQVPIGEGITELTLNLLEVETWATSTDIEQIQATLETGILQIEVYTNYTADTDVHTDRCKVYELTLLPCEVSDCAPIQWWDGANLRDTTSTY